MKIKLITPAPPHSRNGNRITAVRWAGILKKLGHRITVHQRYDGTSCDLLIALHARRSYESIHHFRERDPNALLIVVLTGTDLYRDIRTNRKAQRSLRLATRLIVLQKQGLEELPPELRRKTRVIYQSAEPVNGRLSPQTGKEFKVCVIGHLRPEKDPFRTARASRLLPSSSQIQLLHVGEALTKEMKDQARKESRHNDRYRWLGKLTHGKTRHLLARSHLLSLTSKMEGSSNVLSEAIASSVPVLASKIAGLNRYARARLSRLFPHWGYPCPGPPPFCERNVMKNFTGSSRAAAPGSLRWSTPEANVNPGRRFFENSLKHRRSS